MAGQDGLIREVEDEEVDEGMRKHNGLSVVCPRVRPESLVSITSAELEGCPCVGADGASQETLLSFVQAATES